MFTMNMMHITSLTAMKLGRKLELVSQARHVFTSASRQLSLQELETLVSSLETRHGY